MRYEPGGGKKNKGHGAEAEELGVARRKERRKQKGARRNGKGKMHF